MAIGTTKPTEPVMCPESFRSWPSLSVMHSPIDSLPLDTLVQILCRLDHDELKRSILVSKSFHNAVLVARQLHFDYSTPAPSKRMALISFAIDWSPRSSVLRQERRKPPQRPKLSGEETSKIAVVLFPAGECKKELTSESGWAQNQANPSLVVSDANI